MSRDCSFVTGEFDACMPPMLHSLEMVIAVDESGAIPASEFGLAGVRRTVRAALCGGLGVPVFAPPNGSCRTRCGLASGVRA